MCVAYQRPLPSLRSILLFAALSAYGLLISMWVRSYWTYDQFITPVTINRTIRVITVDGHASFSVPPVQYFRDKGYLGSVWSMRDHSSGPFVEKRRFTSQMQGKLFVYWTSRPRGSGGQVVIPFWMFALIGGFLLVLLVSKRRRRFSLRTLLIVTTLTALALGIAFAQSD
jgi:hypothetical protein